METIDTSSFTKNSIEVRRIMNHCEFAFYICAYIYINSLNTYIYTCVFILYCIAQSQIVFYPKHVVSIFLDSCARQLVPLLFIRTGIAPSIKNKHIWSI